jgi:hypothetical protein
MRKITLLSLLLMTFFTFASAQSINLGCYQSRVLQYPHYHYYDENFTIKIKTFNLSERQIVEFGYPVSTNYVITFETSETMTDIKGKRFSFISGVIHNSSKYKRIFISSWYGTSDVWVTLDNGLIISGERRETAYYCKLQKPAQRPY